MNRTEVVALLAYAAFRDSRKPDDDVAEAWFEDLGDLPFEDCKAAIRQHMRESTEYLMPVHIRRIVKTIRDERVRVAGDLTTRIPAEIDAMPDGPEQLAAEQAWLKEIARRIADGELVDDIAPRLQLVPGDEAKVKAITEGLAAKLRAPGVKPRTGEPA